MTDSDFVLDHESQPVSRTLRFEAHGDVTVDQAHAIDAIATCDISPAQRWVIVSIAAQRIESPEQLLDIMHDALANQRWLGNRNGPVVAVGPGGDFRQHYPSVPEPNVRIEPVMLSGVGLGRYTTYLLAAAVVAAITAYLLNGV